MTQRWRAIQYVSAQPDHDRRHRQSPRSSSCNSSTSPGCLWGRRDGVKIPGAAGLRLAGVAGAPWPGLAGLCGFPPSRADARWRMRWCGRPLTSYLFGGPDPVHKSDAGSCLEGCELVLRARGPDFRLPLAPAGGRDRYRILMIGERDGRGRGRAAVLRAGRRDRHRQAEVMVTIRVPSETRRGGRAAGDPGVRHHAPAAAGAGGLAALLAGGAGRDGGHQRLLEAGVLPAGAGGLRLPALPGVAGQGAARAAEDRQAGLGLAGEDHRAGVAGRAASCPRRTSAGCAPIPATAGG